MQTSTTLFLNPSDQDDAVAYNEDIDADPGFAPLLFGRDQPATATGFQAAVTFARRLLPEPADIRAVFGALHEVDGITLEQLLADSATADPVATQAAIIEDIVARCLVVTAGTATIDERLDFALLAGGGRGKTHVVAQVARQLIARNRRPAPPDARLRASEMWDFAICTPTHKAASVLRQQLCLAGVSNVGVFTCRQAMQQLSWCAHYHAAEAWLAEPVTAAEDPVLQPEAELQGTGLSDQFLSYVRALLPARIDAARDAYRSDGMAAALQHLGIDPFRMFVPTWVAREKPFAKVIIVDEATMLSQYDLLAARHVAEAWIFCGDDMQLPPIVDNRLRTDNEAEPPSAISGICWDRVRSMGHNFRAAAGSLHFVLADFAAEHGRRFEEVSEAAHALASLSSHVALASAYDASLIPRSPILVWRNIHRMALSISWRDFMGFPRDRLVPGEPLLITQVPEKLRDAYDGMLAKNVIVRAGASAGGRTRLVLNDGTVTDPLPLWCGFNNVAALLAAGVKLSGDEVWQGIILQAGRSIVMAEPAGAVTVHRSQGSEWPVVQINWSDLGAYARSQYGAEVNPALPGLKAWQRLVYVALSRASQQVRIHGLMRAIPELWVSRPTDIGADLPPAAQAMGGHEPRDVEASHGGR